MTDATLRTARPNGSVRNVECSSTTAAIEGSIVCTKNAAPAVSEKVISPISSQVRVPGSTGRLSVLAYVAVACVCVAIFGSPLIVRRSRSGGAGARLGCHAGVDDAECGQDMRAHELAGGLVVFKRYAGLRGQRQRQGCAGQHFGERFGVIGRQLAFALKPSDELDKVVAAQL